MGRAHSHMPTPSIRALLPIELPRPFGKEGERSPSQPYGEVRLLSVLGGTFADMQTPLAQCPPMGSHVDQSPPGRLARRTEILRMAMLEIFEHGYEQTSMEQIAKRASASKETLYSWFGDKTGLVLAAIEMTADRDITIPRPEKVGPSHTREDAREALLTCAKGLLQLSTSCESVGLSRAAMSSPIVAEALRSSGRGRTTLPIERYLARLHELGILHIPDASEGFHLFHGLTVRNTQIRVLLGAKPPSRRARQKQAERAVDQFLALCLP